MRALTERASKAALLALVVSGALMAAPLIAISATAGMSQEQSADPSDNQREKVPGRDPEKTLSEQLHEDKGVINPPPIGDPDIYTQAPNPHAGHEEEVIPPSGTPGGDPKVEPK